LRTFRVSSWWPMARLRTFRGIDQEAIDFMEWSESCSELSYAPFQSWLID
jgi:hypothetical protein